MDREVINETQFINQIQGYESNPEMFNLSTGMDMIGFSKNLQQQQQQNSQESNNSCGTAMWKGFFSKTSTLNNPNGPSSSKAINESNTDFYQQQHDHEFNIKADFTTGISETSSDNLLLGPHHHHDHQSGPPNWQENNRFLLVDDSNLRCVFPCEGNERPSQGLSLSLSSNNPSSIGLQSFELRHPSSNNHHQDGYFSKSSDIQQQQQIIPADGFFGKAVSFQLRSSEYLAPAQELLNEFCSLGTKQSDHVQTKLNKSHKSKQWEDDNIGSASSSRKQPLSSLEFMDFQRRKTNLLSMLQEVERRYKHYCDQMRDVVSSFEEVAGNGAARVYTTLASKAMSRHFRCLKDGILSQIQATRKALGEKDSATSGTTRGETPRLRVLDQTLRQQRAFQQLNMLETHPWRPQRGLPERSVSLLRAWLFEHFLHPYPSDVDKHILARQTGLSRSQVSNWFINARVRLWKPMVEEMYLEEAKEEGDNINNNMSSLDGFNRNPNPNVPEEEKPTPDQLVRIDSECLSSIITNQDKNIDDHTRSNKTFQNHNHMHSQQNFGRVSETFGTMDLDFSSYNQHSEVGGVSYGNHHHNVNSNQNLNGGGVSLTLGLQQHGGSGVSIAFSPASQNSLFYPRAHDIDECQPVQYSLLDADQGHNLPYRNLIGAQLLHDLTG